MTIELNYFIAVLKDTHTLKRFTGIELISQLKKYSTRLILEVDEYRILNDPNRWEAYHKLIIDKITMTTDIEDVNNTPTEVEKYLLTYKISLDDVENDNIDDVEFNSLISEFYFAFRDNDMRQEAFHCQRNLVDYFKAKYIKEVIEHCNSANRDASKCNVKNDTVQFKNVFVSAKSEKWFFEAMEESGYYVNCKVKRGFQAYAHAIFKNEDAQRIVFKYNLKFKDYISFLTETYDVKISSNKDLSDGIIHEDFISNLIKNFLLPKDNKSTTP